MDCIVDWILMNMFRAREGLAMLVIVYFSN